MKPALKCLVISPHSIRNYCGAMKRITTMTRFLYEQGYEVTILSPEDHVQKTKFKNFRAINYDYAPVYRNISTAAEELSQKIGVPKCGASTMIMYDAYKDISEFKKILAKHISINDIVIEEYPFFASVVSPLCRKFKKPLIITDHDIQAHFGGKNEQAHELLLHMELEALKGADGVVAVSEDDSNYLLGKGVDSICVENGLDVLSVPHGEFIAKDHIKESLGIPRDRKVCLFVGHYHPPNLKAVEHIKVMAKTLPEITFVIAGRCCPKMRAENVISLNYISGTLLSQLYRMTDLVLAPLESDGTPSGGSVKFIEALAYGTAVITTQVGCRSWDFKNELHGVICDGMRFYPKIIQELLYDEQKLSNYRKASRELAERYDYRTLFQPYNELIDNLLGERRKEFAEPRQKNMHEDFLMVDANIWDQETFSYDYGKALLENLEVEGHSITLVTHQDFSKNSDIKANILNCFEHDFLKLRCDNSDLPIPLNMQVDMTQSNVELYNKLWPLFEERVGMNDIIFFPYVNFRQLLAISWFMQEWSPRLTPKLVLRVNHAPPTADSFVHEYEGFQRLTQAARDDQLQLIADTPALAEAYEKRFGFPCEVVPLSRHWESYDSIVKHDTNHGKVQIGVLGDSRLNKGLFRLVNLFEVVKQTALKDVLAFHVQYYERTEQSSLESVYHQIETQNLPFVQLYRGRLSFPEYVSLFKQCDVILLPYDPILYSYMASGIFVEALGLGKPVITTQGTWMSQQLQNYGAGVCYEDGNLDSFCSAIAECVTNFEGLRKKAEKGQEVWRKAYSVEAFMEKLMNNNSLRSSGS